MTRITPSPLDPGAALDAFTKRAGEGGIAIFVGTVRGETDVSELSIDHYPGYSDRGLQEIADLVLKRHALSAVEIIHRVGPMHPGDPIVFAATAAPHRRAALDALDELMDRLKTDAPFWKKEVAGGAIKWIEPTEEDEHRRQQLESL